MPCELSALEADMAQLIVKVNDLFNAGQTKDLAEMFTEDAVVITPGHDLINGRQGVLHSFTFVD